MWGILVSINLYGCDKNIIRDKKKINEFITQLCKEIKMNKKGDSIIKKFGKGHLNGYSAFQFIDTSSITLHFDETKNMAFIDIFSCKKFDEKRAEKFSKIFFDAKKSKSKVLIRK